MSHKWKILGESPASNMIQFCVRLFTNPHDSVNVVAPLLPRLLPLTCFSLLQNLHLITNRDGWVAFQMLRTLQQICENSSCVGWLMCCCG